jgi:hypothetical protein
VPGEGRERREGKKWYKEIHRDDMYIYGNIPKPLICIINAC